ncbi:MAG: hypothetical protein K6F75_09090 [Butyrivibrio sp.]|nr:hypothetical protein [Butyrivibrio sp.]
MNCPNCKKALPDNVNTKINFCPYCGGKLYEDGKEFLIEVVCTGQRNLSGGTMMLFVDDAIYYEVDPGSKIYFTARAGFHTLKFRHKIRNKTIQLLLGANYSIKVYYNSLSGLIETNVSEVDEKQYDSVFGDARITPPVMVTSDGQKGFDIMLGEDEPEYEINVTSGLKEGILKVYAERCEFGSEKDFKKEVVQYKDVVEVRKKMGAVDLFCVGNVHKVYSIPKDTYNEVMAFLTNRVEEVNGR